MPKAPCLYCQNRKLNCHSECTKYIKFRKSKDEINQKIQDGKKLNFNSKETFFSY